MKETLPLLHDGDAFILALDVQPNYLQVTSIHRTPNNSNVNSVLENYHDLDPDAQKAIVAQIRRRHSKLKIYL